MDLKTTDNEADRIILALGFAGQVAEDSLEGSELLRCMTANPVAAQTMIRNFNEVAAALLPQMQAALRRGETRLPFTAEYEIDIATVMNQIARASQTLDAFCDGRLIV